MTYLAIAGIFALLIFTTALVMIKKAVDIDIDDETFEYDATEPMMKSKRWDNEIVEPRAEVIGGLDRDNYPRGRED